MTVKEYIDGNLPFYHITPVRNLDGILEKGLRRGHCYNAICVVRSGDEDILYDIAFTQLTGEGDDEFVVIRLLPRKHGITADDVAPDNIDEPTAPLHNYIYDKRITITVDDIARKLSKKDYRIKELDKTKITGLEGYCRKGPEQGFCNESSGMQGLEDSMEI